MFICESDLVTTLEGGLSSSTNLVIQELVFCQCDWNGASHLDDDSFILDDHVPVVFLILLVFFVSGREIRLCSLNWAWEQVVALPLMEEVGWDHLPHLSSQCHVDPPPPGPCGMAAGGSFVPGSRSTLALEELDSSFADSQYSSRASMCVMSAVCLMTVVLA